VRQKNNHSVRRLLLSFSTLAKYRWGLLAKLIHTSGNFVSSLFRELGINDHTGWRIVEK
jgi:hypothetical protein